MSRLRAHFLPFLAALLAAPALAQYGRLPTEPVAPPSRVLAPPLYPTELEARLDARDRLIVEQRRALAPVPLKDGHQLVLETVIASEYGREQERVLGVRVSVGKAGVSNTAYLDLHEVEDLLRALQSVPSLLETTPPSPDGDLEIRHVTQDGFGVVLRASDGNVSRYVRLGEDPVTYYGISKPSADDLLRQLDACRKFLFGS